MPGRPFKDFSFWCDALDELATERGIALPLDLEPFRAEYAAGATPIEALEEFATGRLSF